MIGPKRRPQEFGFKAGDTHMVVNDQSERAKAFDAAGRLVWEVPCLARGQGSDTTWNQRYSDTPPGLWKLGKAYQDWQGPAVPAFTRTLRMYGWVSFAMVPLEDQEQRFNRSGIMVHGGGTDLGWPGAWAPRQALLPTLGCIRMRNADLLERLLPLYHNGTVFVSVWQEG